ncbi:hypothetical protein PBCVCvsA1_098R [Paramecium bursaria Chlorella virus CvsA1]|nr:hypothetical protein PBCVCvsA1_098R [Paramecium bursaria Chlorella virus CvsA1]
MLYALSEAGPKYKVGDVTKADDALANETGN